MWSLLVYRILWKNVRFVHEPVVQGLNNILINFSKHSHVSLTASFSFYLNVTISSLIFAFLVVGMYFTRNLSTKVCHAVIVSRGRIFSHVLAWPVIEKWNNLSFKASIEILGNLKEFATSTNDLRWEWGHQCVSPQIGS